MSYGCEIPPYRLPKFVPIILFSLKYIRQMTNMDYLHFVSNKKKYQLKLKTQIGPFIANTIAATKEEYFLLKQMKFKLCFTWSYDPLGIISKLRVEKKTTPYAHTPRLEIG